jgi:hypothetical protein
MTPTRTETTLRRGRRAFERITLNNTHSHSHSPDATRSSAMPSVRPAVVTRASNEQKSNNMPGEHTKEQLINWVMSKDAVASCFIKDVLSMSESEHGGATRLPPWFFPTSHPNSASDRSSLLPSRSRALQIRFVGCHRGRSRSVRTSSRLYT